MAARRLLSHAFQGPQLLRKAQDALHGNGPAECMETNKFDRIDPWFLQRRDVAMPPHSQAQRSVIHRDRWQQESNNLNNATRDRLHPEVFSPQKGKISVEEGRRLLRFVQVDSLIKKLRQIPHACISRKELLQICISMDFAGEEDAKKVVKSLDESGQILIVGHRVYLRPEQVARNIEKVVPVLDDRRSEELEEMAKQKAAIDLDAMKIVRRELWCGFGFLSLQTTVCMWLTFWRLSWDVMEPICFYLTSIYFLSGYMFFLLTSTDPTYEGLFKARFKSRQKRLMKKRNFDIERFNKLRLMVGSPLKQSAC